jgi:CHAT domain-containing protein
MLGWRKIIPERAAIIAGPFARLCCSINRQALRLISGEIAGEEPRWLVMPAADRQGCGRCAGGSAMRAFTFLVAGLTGSPSWHPRPSRGLLRNALLAVMLGATSAFAQQPSDAAFKRSREISAAMEQLSQRGDFGAAHDKAVETSAAFAKEGEAWLAASYAVAAAEYDIRAGNAQRIDAEIYPRMQELLDVLDPVDSSRGDTLVEVLMDAKGMLGDAAKQDELARIYESRFRKAHGEGSEPDLSARIRASFSLMQSSRFDEGYKRLRDALVTAARSDHYAFTINNYLQAADLMNRNGLNQEADELFSEGEKTRAMQQDVKERADFYLAYAQFRAAVPKEGTHFVPLFTAATNLYAQYYGNESKELIDASDKLAQALSAVGQLGTAASLAQDYYDLALKALGPDDTITWRLANNLADVLRGIGAPSRALEYDKLVLANRTRHYGRNHFNTLVSANNTAQDYLDLGDYPEAIRYFEMNRDIALTLTNDPGLVPQAEAWILYTRLLAGLDPLNEKNVAAMDALTTNGDYPAILSYKAATLLADHFGKAGDDTRAMKHLEQAYNIAGSTMSLSHPLTYAARIAMANLKAKADPKAAAADFASIDKDLTPWISIQVGFSGNRDVAEATRALADEMLYDYARLAEKEPSAVPAFADAVRRWPSLEDGKRDALRKLARAVGPNDTEMQDLLKEAMRISFSYRELFADKNDESQAFGYELLDRLKKLDDKINRRANEVYQFDSSALDKPLPTANELLKTDEALVQYFITRKWKAERESTDPLVDTRLYAIVSRKDKEPRLYDLGDPRAITSQEATVQMASLRSTRSAEARGALPMTAVRGTFSELYGKLIAPVEADLAGASTVFVIPDGQLFALPFSLLEDGDDRLLEERFTVRLLTRPESLYGVTAEQTLAKGGRAVLAGGIDYANGSEKGAEPLPGTMKEVEEIAGILRKDDFSIETLTGTAASEMALRKDMEGATLAHLATHGAYQSAKTGGASDVDTLWQSDVILATSGDRRSMKRDENDGRLYAFELMSWNLSKLDLLVLSACETGRGEETFVGGLRGLPTAINIAGAKRALLTLWPVADEGTANFMVRFYEHLTEGKTYPEALRQTRREAIDGKIEAAKDPLVWAAFVMFEN